MDLSTLTSSRTESANPFVCAQKGSLSSTSNRSGGTAFAARERMFSANLHYSTLALLALGCGEADGTLESSEDDVVTHRAKVGAYFVDGTTMQKENNTIIWQLAELAKRSPQVQASAYFAGPVLFCDEPGPGSCEAVTHAVAAAVCKDLTAGTIDRFAVFGYSRGVFIANKAAIAAAKRCGRNAYAFGGFVDGVHMSIYLKDATRVPAGTPWLHIQRQSFSLLFPQTSLEGTDGVNVAGPEVSHDEIGEDLTVKWDLARACNQALNVRVFSTP